jgi:cytochrome c1
MAVSLAVAALAWAGCRDHETRRIDVATGGDARHGREVIEAVHCGACHTIPGVPGAHGVIAPPLTDFAARTFIAGELPNTAANLIAWVRDPRSIEPSTAMPAVGLGDRDARDVAAYLYEAW